MANVDELFGEGRGAPKPRLLLPAVLLVSGLLVTIVGMVCTAAPGGLMVLAAWLLVEREVGRLESGYLPKDHERAIRTMERVAMVAVVIVILLFVTQMILLCAGYYKALWGAFFMTVRSLLSGVVPA